MTREENESTEVDESKEDGNQPQAHERDELKSKEGGKSYRHGKPLGLLESDTEQRGRGPRHFCRRGGATPGCSSSSLQRRASTSATLLIWIHLSLGVEQQNIVNLLRTTAGTFIQIDQSWGAENGDSRRVVSDLNHTLLK